MTTKISDFGLTGLTRGYMSAEIAAPMILEFDDNDDPVCDIFSVGVILWHR